MLATVGSDFAAYADVARPPRHPPRLDPLARRRGHRGRLHHDRPRRQPDHRLPPRRDGARPRGARRGRERRRTSSRIVSPNGKRAMVEHARALKARGVPTVVDPGQGLPILERDELVEMIEGAAVYVVNDYEWSLTLERSGLDGDAVARARRRGDRDAGRARLAAAPRRATCMEIPAVAAEQRRRPDRRRRRLPRRPAPRHGARPARSSTRRASAACSARSRSPTPGTQACSLDLAGFRARFEREFGAPL